MKRYLFLGFMFILLTISLMPLILMFFTATIPGGNITKVVKERYINDFEYRYKRLLRRKVRPYNGAKYTIAEESPKTKKSLKVELKKGEKQGVSLLTNDMDLRLLKYLDFWVKGDGIRSVIVRFKDVYGHQFDLSIPIPQGKDAWKKIRIEGRKLKGRGINLKHITKITFIAEAPHDTAMFLDDVNVIYQFPTLLNFVNVWKEDMFWRYMLNSAIVALFVVLGNTIFGMMVAYAFARRHFFGKEFFFMLIIGTMMIPPQTTIIPIFILMKHIGWIDTYYVLIVPSLVTPFTIFLLKQYIEQLPKELEEAAYVDGANTFQILLRVVFPLSKPAIAVMGINTFIGAWNMLFYPLVMTSSKQMRTVQVGLALYQKLNQIDWPRLMAASSIIGIPVIIVFLIFQKQIIAGITKGAVKG